MKKEVTICDGCGKILAKTNEIYHFCLKTDKFWSGADMDNIEMNLDFCYACARQLKDTMQKIAMKISK